MHYQKIFSKLGFLLAVLSTLELERIMVLGETSRLPIGTDTTGTVILLAVSLCLYLVFDN